MRDMRSDLEEKLDRYDRVLLFSSGTSWSEAAFARSDALRKTDRRIWIYSSSRIAYPENIGCGRIGPAEEKGLLDIYHLYECSDRFQVVSLRQDRGSLFHYVEQGLLSMEEMVGAWLY